MTAIDTTVTTPATPSAIRARPAGFVHDVASIAGRALRAVPRDVEAVIPPIFIALFFFVVNVGTLSDLTENNIPGFDFSVDAMQVNNDSLTCPIDHFGHFKNPQ